ncbi:MAG TPA: hypothetical protein VKB45_17710 [Gemmatimonadales bacterium]|nr:hypothetical protein [Gemmatimonadales bacterium]
MMILSSAAPVLAQRGGEAIISIRVMAGSSASEPTLWTIARQPILVPGTELSPVYDTVSLSRSLTTGLTFGAAILFFPTSMLGVQTHLSYQSLGLTTSCAGTSFFQLGMRHDNELLCANIQSQSQPLHLFELGIGAVVRFAPRQAISPFTFLSGGLANITSSTIYLEGADANGIRVVIKDENPRGSTWVMRFGAGFSISLGAGYQFWFAGTDAYIQLARLTGPADRLATAPSTTRFFSNAIFTFGVDIVLGGKRGRRY